MFRYPQLIYQETVKRGNICERRPSENTGRHSILLYKHIVRIAWCMFVSVYQKLQGSSACWYYAWCYPIELLLLSIEEKWAWTVDISGRGKKISVKSRNFIRPYTHACTDKWTDKNSPLIFQNVCIEKCFLPGTYIVYFNTDWF